jgi:HAD superfamily hydrolase (TIGR01509 family)
MFKAAIFDLDGVIVDSHPSHIKVWKTFLCSIGMQVTDADLQFVRDGSRKEEILRYFLGDVSDDQVRVYGWEKERLFADEVQNLKAIPGLQRILGELRGARIPSAVASNGSAPRVHRILEALKLRAHFAAVVTANEVAMGKPNPAIFQKAAEQLQVSPFETLVFEDSVAGVCAAKAAGMTCLGIADHQRARALQEAGADRVFADFTQVSLSHLQEVLSCPL